MDFGVQVNVYRTSWEAVKPTVEAMEAGSWDSVWFADHFIPPGANKEQEALTAFEGLTAIDPQLDVSRNGDYVNLSLGNSFLGSMPAPSDNDTEAWADLTVEMIENGRIV
ncbi:MAG TPA: hypothetical protein QF517_06155, partial [Pseudomonadales bacterium]|nr:hypothetical protein [Pseudomonadales bacterium]